MEESPDQQSGFHALAPHTVIDLVEEAVGVRCSNICRPLNSYINRVYEVILDDGDAVIAKFYRPGRWDREAIEEELAFVRELNKAEIPVVPPIPNPSGDLLNVHGDMLFSVCPKKGGRICDEPTDAQWMELGRLLGRVHTIGAARPAEHRIHMTPGDVMADHIEHILDSDCVAPECMEEYEHVAHETLDLIEPLFDGTDLIRIHGDCHHQNLIYRPGESFFLIDFDDMAMGPPIHDVWMLLPGRLQDARIEAELFLEGYETFRRMDRSALRLIEPLRAMRYIHFTSWCVQQVEDGGFKRLSPDWGSASYWKQEIHELRKQQVEITDAQELSLPGLI